MPKRYRLDWMPLDVDDYEADCGHLTLEQDGAYMRLLRRCWKNRGWLPDDDGRLAAICGVTKTHWIRHLAPAVKPFFHPIGDGKLGQKRLEKELEKSSKFAEKRAENARKFRENRDTKVNDINDVVRRTGDHITVHSTSTVIESPLSPTESQLDRGESEALRDAAADAAAGDGPTLFPLDVAPPSGKVVPLRPRRAAVSDGDVILAINAYNVTAARHGLPQASPRQTPKRTQMLRERIRDLGGLDGWDAAMEKLTEAEFITQHGWENFTFGKLLRAETMATLMEGGYRHARRSNTGRVSTNEIQAAEARVLGRINELMR